MFARYLFIFVVEAFVILFYLFSRSLPPPDLIRRVREVGRCGWRSAVLFSSISSGCIYKIPAKFSQFHSVEEDKDVPLFYDLDQNEDTDMRVWCRSRPSGGVNIRSHIRF